MIKDMNANKQDCKWSTTSECWKRRKLYILTISTSFVIAMLFYVLSPKLYAASTKVSVETNETDLIIGLNSFNAWIRQDFMQESVMSDLEVFSKILKSPDFIEELCAIKIPKYNISYYEYIKNTNKPILPFIQRDVFYLIDNKIKYQISSKRKTLLIQVVDVDPFVAAMMVDSVRSRLHTRVVKYKQSQAMQDLTKTENAKEIAENEYNIARNAYSQMYDMHFNLRQTSMEYIKLADLDRMKQLAKEQYNIAYEKYIRSIALSKRESLVFTTIKNASVPEKPVSPNILAYLFVSLFVSVILTTWWILFNKKYNIITT